MAWRSAGAVAKPFRWGSPRFILLWKRYQCVRPTDGAMRHRVSGVAGFNHSFVAERP
jgi:hypothetical protein